MEATVIPQVIIWGLRQLSGQPDLQKGHPLLVEIRWQKLSNSLSSGEGLGLEYL